MKEKRTALIVDDSISIRQIVSCTLKEAGFKVLECQNGQEALDRMADERVDVVVTDINMPVLNGIHFVRRLRQNPDWQRLPVLVLTTESVEAKKQEAKAAGATGWIVKPVHPMSLLGVITKVLT